MTLTPRHGNDCINTPPAIARAIINHFRPRGRIMEPCKGSGVFTRLMPGCDWCEISKGRDFLTFEPRHRYDWVVTNPPWSKMLPFLKRSMEIADNVVFLGLLPAWFQKSKLRAMEDAGFGIVEALMFDDPPHPWPRTGFQLAAVYMNRGYAYGIRLTRHNP